MFNVIMVPLDGFAFSERALPVAERLARLTGAELRLVHVLDPIRRPEYALDLPAREWLGGDAPQYGQEYLHGVAERVGPDIRVTTRVVEPPIVDALVQQALSVDLVVMTTHGRGPIGRAWLGSVTDQFARRASGPVLFVPLHDEHHMPGAKPFEHILVPLDGSLAAERILTAAFELAALDRARLTLLNVSHPRMVPAPVFPFVYAGQFEPAAVLPTEEQRDDAERLHDLAASAEQQQLRAFAEVVMTESSPAAEILNVARSRGADLIALTTHGQGGLKRLLLGSVADKVLRGADCPVLLLRPAATRMMPPRDA